MISGYLCLQAMLLSACCPRCQDHHGKSLSLGNTVLIRASAEEAHFTIPSLKVKQDHVNLSKRLFVLYFFVLGSFLGLCFTCKNVGIVKFQESFIKILPCTFLLRLTSLFREEPGMTVEVKHRDRAGRDIIGNSQCFSVGPGQEA